MISVETLSILSIQERQKKLLNRLLHLNQPNRVKKDSASLPNWKTLIYDQRGLCILSTLFKVADLYKEGITFTGLISSERTPIPDNPAIYFVEPTTQNFNYIASDLQKSLYKEFYICFISYTNNSQPSEFAQIVKSKLTSISIPPIKLVYDCFSDFSSTHSNLFQLYDPQISNFSTHLTEIYSLEVKSDNNVEESFHLIAQSLLSIIITNGACPLILFSANSASEEVVHKLCDLINSNSLIHQKLESSTSTNISSFNVSSRPLLLLFDRSIDFIIPLYHSHLYEPLIHDLIGIQRNTVTFTLSNVSQRATKTFDLDENIDEFWKHNHFAPYDQVSDSIKEQAAQLKDTVAANKNDLKGALEEFEKTNLWKQSISTHVNIVNELQTQIMQSSLNKFAVLEDAALDESLTQNEIAATFSPDSNGPKIPKNHKIRSLVFLYSSGVISLEQMRALAEANGIQNEVKFIEKNIFKVKNIQKKGFVSSIVPGLGKNTIPSCAMVRLTQKLLDNNGSGLSQQEQDQLTQSYKICDPLESSQNLVVNYKWDAMKRMDRTNVIAFMVGPGCYHEYCELIKYGNSTDKRITYGCTYIPRPDDYVEELSKL